MDSSAGLSYISLPAALAAALIFAAFACTHRSSPKLIATRQQSSALETAAANIHLQMPVLTYLREPLKRYDTESAERYEEFIARDYCFLESKSSLSTTALTEAMLCFQVDDLQANLTSVHFELSAAPSFVPLATSE